LYVPFQKDKLLDAPIESEGLHTGSEAYGKKLRDRALLDFERAEKGTLAGF